jgi:hypothetical protein
VKKEGRWGREEGTGNSKWKWKGERERKGKGMEKGKRKGEWVSGVKKRIKNPVIFKQQNHVTNCFSLLFL